MYSNDKSQNNNEQLINVPTTKTNNPFVSKINKKHIILGIVGLLVVIVFVCIFVFTNAKLDPFDYVTITFSGYNQQGTVDINYSKLVDRLSGKEPSNFKDYVEWEEKHNQYNKDISCEVDVTEGLSNGDKITISFTIVGDTQELVKSAKKIVTVSGLTELDTVDVFKDLTVSFEGVSGKADVKIIPNSKLAEACCFEVDPKYNLNDGEIIQISITNSDELIETYNVLPELLIKEYKVEGLSSYLSSSEQITKMAIDSIAQRFIAEEEASHDEKDGIFSYSDVEFYKAYFGTKKEDARYAKNNILLIYIRYDEYVRGDYNRTIYLPMEFTDIIVDPDGNVELNYEDGVSATFTTDIEGSIAKIKKDYDLKDMVVTNR